MQIGFTNDQIQFREVVSRFLADKSPPTEVRNLMASEQGYDAEVWAQLSQEIGLVGTHLPVRYGGFGFGDVELGIITQEMGRYLYCGPYFASAVMAGYAVLNAATEAQKETLLPSIAAGSTLAALVLDDLNSPQNVGQAIRFSDGRLTGVAKAVVDAQVADLLIVVAASKAGISLYKVASSNTQIKPLTCLDPTRKLSRVTFDHVPGELISAPGGAQLSLLWDQMNTALAHEMVGGAEHLFETTIDYMKTRVQFGRLIGSFQAPKHRCADLLLALELAKAATHEAARYLTSGEGDSYAPNMAKALASDAYSNIAKAAIQLRGGIGFTWEEDTHLWFKRAKSSEVFLGTANWHREQMMQRLTEKDHA